MRKWFAKLHLWLSIPAGIVIVIVCLSGATLIFEKEITQGLNPSLYRVKAETGATPMEPSMLITTAMSKIPDTLRVASLTVSADPHEAWMLSFDNINRSELSVNPYTGEVNGWTKSYPFFRTMRQLHRWLLDAPKSRGDRTVGKGIVGYSTIALVLIVITGLAIWIPKNRKGLKHRLRVSTGKGWYRFWYDSHVALGFYAAIFILIMALTGLTWSFGWYRDAVYGLFGVKTEKIQPARHGHQQVQHVEKGTDDRHGKRSNRGEQRRKERNADYTTWDTALRNVKAQYPAYKTITLSERAVGIAPKSLSSMRRNDVAKLTPDGDIETIEYYKDKPQSQKIRGLFYVLHTGGWGGMWTKILYFCATIIGASLPITGYYFWLRKKVLKRKKKKSTQQS